jgi:hypothetical protein
VRKGPSATAKIRSSDWLIIAATNAHPSHGHDRIALVASAEEVANELRKQIPQLREQKEARRKAALSPIEALEERVKDLERGRAEDRAEIAALHAQFAAHFGRGPSSPSLQHKSSSVPPMLMATAQRGGGAVSAFFGDDPHERPEANPLIHRRAT